MKKKNLFNYILLVLPIIDVITSLTVKYFETNITFGIIVKSLMIAYFLIYIFFLTTSKYKRISKIVMRTIMIYILFYFLFKVELLNNSFIFTEFSYLFKMIFFPILFFGLLCFYDDTNFNKEDIIKIIVVNVISYSALLLIPLLTGTANNTYLDGSNGFIGWFYSGNEISAIMVLIFPFLYSLLQNKKKLFLLPMIIIVFSISMIGTKVSLFGTIFGGILVLFLCFKFKSTEWKSFLMVLITLFVIILMMFNGAAYKNMNRIVGNIDNEDSSITEVDSIVDDNYFNKIAKLSLSLLSGRDIFIINTHKVYLNNIKYDTVLFGLGFSNTTKINDLHITKLIEIDFLDIFYHFGIVGLIIAFLPYIFTLIFLIKRISYEKLNRNIIFYILMILLSVGISCVSGHVLIDPAVSIYILLIMMMLLDELDLFKRSPVVAKKVQIMSLHLGYGGSERATVDLANMLSERYDVEIVSLYKTLEHIPYKVNDKVKIRFLSKLKPNKAEFITALKNKNIVKIFKEGATSIKVLYYKMYYSKKFVTQCDAKYLISSRIYFSKIIQKYGRNDNVNIAIEHNYNINDKYIKKLVKTCSSFDYLVCVSKICAKTYKKYFKTCKVLFIPNAVSEEYKIKSSLNSNQLISVGRLEPEKGALDLIEIMNLIHFENSSITLDIFGDGTLREEMEKRISDLKLQSVIKIHGYKDSEYISKYYKNSSLFLLMSHKESFGIVIVEAMKCGVPAIAFDEATGAVELIKDGINGYLVPGRDLKKMKDVIVKYLNSPNKCKKTMQDEAIKTSKKYSYYNVKKEWYKVLEK